MQIPFIGPSYVSRSLNIDAQRSINLYLELKESGDAKGEPMEKYSLIGTPGYSLFGALPTYPIRGHWTALGRLFVVAGNVLYEVFSNGSFSALGTLLTNSFYVGMADNSLQLCIVDGPNQYIFTFATNAFVSNPTGANFMGANTVTFIDGYFVYPIPNSNQFLLSALFDGTQISDLDIAQKEGASDFISTIINDHRQLYIFGTETTEPWYDAGSANFPLAPIQGIFIEAGCVAPFSVVKMDNSLFWLGSDKRGQGMVFRIDGFAPTRISNHAIEKIIQSAPDLSAAIAYAYQEDGHTFYVLQIPGLNTTLVYDSASNQWHERQWRNPLTGVLQAHRAYFHSFIFGKHILGDGQNGNLYVSNLDIYTDNGAPLVRIRRAPHMDDDLKRVFFQFFQVDMETGVGTDGMDQGNNPTAMMRYSNDGGHNWTTERTKTIGKIGERLARVYWNKLGHSRDRVFEFKISDPVKVVLIAAKIVAKSGRT